MPPGFKRSRALWDATTNGGIRAWIDAICYELQPVRGLSNYFYKFGWNEIAAFCSSLSQTAISLVPVATSIFKSVLVFASHRSLKEWAFAGAIVLYYWLVRWIHEALDAGPVVLIITALVLIFTVGLGDDENKDGVSAYSVFNKGFVKLMGSVDVDSLLAQHVGGGLAMNMNMNMHNNNNNNDDDDDDHHHRRPRHDAEDDEN